MNELMTDIIILILKKTSFKDIISIRCTTKRLSLLSYNEEIWETLIIKLIGRTASSYLELGKEILHGKWISIRNVSMNNRHKMKIYPQDKYKYLAATLGKDYDGGCLCFCKTARGMEVDVSLLVTLYCTGSFAIPLNCPPPNRMLINDPSTRTTSVYDDVTYINL